MCGRFTHLYTWAELRDLMRITTDLSVPIKPRFNVAPTQQVPIVRDLGDGRREAALMRWGLVPSWAKDVAIGNRMINARGETVASKPAFRSAFKARRCLVPVSGFYEWQKLGARGPKQPWYIRVRDAHLFAFAGLWEQWKQPDGAALLTFTIITTTPNELVGQLHDRMPVIVPPDAFERWLAPPPANGDDLQALLVPFPAAHMEAFRVSSAVNTPRGDGPQLIEPIAQ